MNLLIYEIRKLYSLNLPSTSLSTPLSKYYCRVTCIWQVPLDENQMVNNLTDISTIHSSTLKLSGRYSGPLEKLPFLIMSVLRFCIFWKAFPSTAFTIVGVIFSPLWRFSSSMKVWIPLSWRALYIWPIKP